MHCVHFVIISFALHKAYAADAVAWENEERIRKGRPIYSPEEYEERVTPILSRIPYKLTISTTPLVVG